MEEFNTGKVKNIMGDRSCAHMLEINPSVEFFMRRNLSVNLEGYYFFRKSHYRDYDDVNATVSNTELSLAYHF